MADDEAGSYEQTEDYVAARVHAYTSLLSTLQQVHEPALKAEGMLMLRATRMSFKTIPQAALTAVPKEAAG